MEIHPPHGPIHSWKELLVQLFTITLGIMIALSFEGAREWRHERVLVREARENLLREVRDNRRGVENTLKQIPTHLKEGEDMLAVIAELQAHKPAKGHTLSLTYSMNILNVASWHTAQTTGALAYMDYKEVQKYADIYAVQEQYNRWQEQLLASVTPALAVMLQDDPAKASPHELETLKQATLTIRSQLYIQQDIGKGLSGLYDKALKADGK
jgi:hypothetical protein